MHSQRIKYAEYIFQPQMCSSDKYIFCIPVVPQNELTCNEIVKYGTINNVSIRNILITLWLYSELVQNMLIMSVPEMICHVA